MDNNKSTVAISNSITVRQVLSNLCTAVAEHRWTDALTILPTALTQSNGRIHAHFIWKVLHLVMMKRHLRHDAQVEILLLIFQSQQLKEHEIALDWLAQAMNHADHSSFETIYQYVKVNAKDNSRVSYTEILFESYIALYFYMEWVKKHNELEIYENALLDTEDEVGEDEAHCELKQSCIALGMKTLELLQKALSNLESGSSNETAKTAGSNKGHKKYLCEWLLAPLLDLEEKLKMKQEGLEAIRKQFGTDNISGLRLMKQYIQDHSQHLPALILYYEYLNKFHPTEERKIISVLKKISTMCPDHILVLKYVEILFQSGRHTSHDGMEDTGNRGSNVEEIQIEKQVISPKKKKKRKVEIKEEHCGNTYINDLCPLYGINPAALVRCISMVTRFLEYSQWQKYNRAWELLKTLLREIHSAWINCWDCEVCVRSRELLKELVKQLSLWPHLFWEITYSHPQTEEEARRLLCIAYAAFILGYDNSITDKVESLLAKHSSVMEKFNIFIKENGPKSDLFLEYMTYERSHRFQDCELIRHFTERETSLVDVPGMTVHYYSESHSSKKKKKKRNNRHDVE